MIKAILSILVCTTICNIAYSQTPQPNHALPPWNDVSIVEINRLPAHAYFKTYKTKEKAEFAQNSSFRKSLNGIWKFYWSDTPVNRPNNFYQNNYDVSNWANIQVPRSWQLAGFGVPIYLNSTFAFNRKPPYIDQSFNPVGSYKHTFTIPKTWQKKQIIISFAGVESAFTVWVNGKQVGYSEGGRAGAEFDISKYLKPGKNNLAVEVIRFSSGAWLEDQDFYRLAGIFRNVDLIARPKGEHLQDFTLCTPLDKNYQNATLELKLQFDRPQNGTVEVLLKDADNNNIQTIKSTINKNIIKINKTINNPKLWSAETPYLYKLIITHYNAKGEIVESIPWNFGFRWVEIKNNRLLVNGKPIIIAGTNRHEHSPIGGHYVTRQEIIDDVITMKKLNFNAIRTCHYPNGPELYEICDRYGMYVTDEANIESHGDQGICRDPQFALSHHHRMQRMVKRDKNFTSVITWSLGNESGSSGAHNDNYTWTKAHDYRPVGYQRHGTNQYTDYNAAFYKTPSRIAHYAKKQTNKPLIQSEYAHAMGNSSGNMKEYWDVHWQDNVVQGAFAWDWIDQGLQVIKPQCTWVTIPGTKAKHLLIEGEPPTNQGLRGILYFAHDSCPRFKTPWTVQMLLKTAPKSNDSFAFYPLFSKDSSIGAVFMERNNLIFQTFGKDRNKLVVPLPDTFFDGKEHSITVNQQGKKVSFYCDKKLLKTLPLKNDLRKKKAGYLSFGPAVGTALIPNRLTETAPTMLTAKLATGNYTPKQMNKQKGIVNIDFRKPIKTLQTTPKQGTFYTYGGYFENRRGVMNPGNFCMNGVVDASGKPHPGGYAFKYVQQPFTSKMVDINTKTINIHNRNFFQPLDNNYTCTWFLNQDGHTIQKGTIKNLQIPPQKNKNITIPWKNFTQIPGKEYRLIIQFTLAHNTLWAAKDHKVAWDDFQIAYTPTKPKFAKGILTTKNSAQFLEIKGQKFSAKFDKKLGTLVQYSMNNKPLIISPLIPDFWRAVTDNDNGAHLGKKNWRTIQGLSNPKLTQQKISNSEYQINVKADLKEVKAKVELTFNVHADGQIVVNYNFIPSAPKPAPKPVKQVKGKKRRKKYYGPDYLLRFGLRTQLAQGLTNIEWYGCGPVETYCDRNYEIIAYYQNTLAGIHTNYSRPQESGNLSQIRYGYIHDNQGNGITIKATPTNPLNLSIRNHHHQTIEAFSYEHQIPPSNKVYLNIDHKLMGIGGINTWGQKPLQKYILTAKPMKYQFIIQGKIK